MEYLIVRPGAVLAVSFVLQVAAAYVGHLLRKRDKHVESGRGNLNTILTASLALLALLIGFSLSMAVSRYDERKTYEEAEANAIETAYLRASLTPAGAVVHPLLLKYIDVRIRFYQASDGPELKQIARERTQLQRQLWIAIASEARERQTPITAMAVTGMTDVLISQGFTQAAWWNHIPIGAWLLMQAVATACNLMLGFSEERASRLSLLILPLIISTAMFLIADVDSPRFGIIRLPPENLIALGQTLRSAEDVAATAPVGGPAP